MDKLFITFDERKLDLLADIYQTEDSQQALEFILEEIVPQKKKETQCWEVRKR
ncbi:hypothetical protein [Acetohalobium arabaticum]|uniref:Uncharacterized protein n=1 Tax=Acetohalobium arabaticum (strain ATCC 49924 / DSM 5501 / Z-7288) TaxID=574087 RepID=D9QT21_ACEAZ|nr:hypothetical protein [Acetohalobium arabaticum]ADL13521.1 hypothetical protein Acear_2026 [Acetohalobium arabaticum DSM 5501]